MPGAHIPGVTGWNAAWTAAFLLLAASLALPFLLVREPPLLDYPNHLARGFVLNHLHDSAYRFAGSYTADWKPYPYILWDVLLVALQQAMPVETAGKLLLALTTVLVPLATAWFLSQANRGSIKLSMVACALSCNVLYLWGFTAYQLGVGFCFLMLGTWLWYRREPSPLRAALFAAITLLTYLAHLMGFASAAFVLVLYELTSRNWREWLRLMAFLAVPSLLFLWARPGLGGPSRLEWRPLADKLYALRDLPTQGYDETLDRILLYGLVFCVLIAVVRNRELRVNWRWLAACAGFFAAYLLLPYGWGASSDIDVRLIAPLCLLSLVTVQVGRRANWIAVLAVALTALRIFNLAAGFQNETQRNAAMNRGIERIARGAKIFPLVDTCKDEDPFDYYYVHYWAYAVVRRGAISPYLFDIPGQTPMRIHDDSYMADGYWDHCYDSEPDWGQVAASYDYIWSYGDQRFAQGIGEIADRIFEESPLVLYRVRKR